MGSVRASMLGEMTYVAKRTVKNLVRKVLIFMFKRLQSSPTSTFNFTNTSNSSYEAGLLTRPQHSETETETKTRDCETETETKHVL